MDGAFRIIGGTSAGLYYRHGDHLGSTSVISDANGLKIPGSDVQYAPFGEMRSGELPTLTDFGYTGQRLDRSTGGLMYYGARYYLPGLRRFISADSVVPDPRSSQALNRYSYVFNNPIRLIDATGHAPGEPCWKVGTCSDKDYHALIYDRNRQLEKYGVEVTFGLPGETREFTPREQFEVLNMILNAVEDIAERLYESGDFESEYEAFKVVMGADSSITVTDNDMIWDPAYCGPNAGKPACNNGSLEEGGADIYILFDAAMDDYGIDPEHIIIHEFGHNLTGPLNDQDEPTYNHHPDPFSLEARIGRDALNTLGTQFEENGTLVGGDSRSPSEVTADAFLNWVLGTDETSINDWMQNIINFCSPRGDSCAI